MLLYKCQNCYKFNQLIEILSDTMKDYLDVLQESEKNKSLRPIRQAKEYVEKHFRDKILLEDIAAIVDLNPVYFSTLFKKETNMNFSTYLINVRMEQAKKLLNACDCGGISMAYPGRKKCGGIFFRNNTDSFSDY